MNEWMDVFGYLDKVPGLGSSKSELIERRTNISITNSHIIRAYQINKSLRIFCCFHLLRLSMQDSNFYQEYRDIFHHYYWYWDDRFYFEI